MARELEDNERIIRTDYTYEPDYPPFTPAECEEICCSPNECPEPCYRAGEKIEGWTGSEIQDHWPDSTKDLIDRMENHAGQGTEADPFIRVVFADRQHPCGKKRITYGAEPDCCDGVPPIVINTDLSAEVVSQSSYADIHVTGGRAPFTFEVRGAGFWADWNRSTKSGTGSAYIRVFTDADACGAARVTISDGCSEVQYWLRSTEGQWEYVPDSTGFPSHFVNSCPEGKHNIPREYGWTYTGEGYVHADGVWSKYKVEESMFWPYWTDTHSSCAACEADIENYVIFNSRCHNGFTDNYPCLEASDAGWQGFPCTIDRGGGDVGCSCLSTRRVAEWVC